MGKQFIHICVMCGKDYENNKRVSYKCPKCEQKIVFIKKIETLDKAENKLNTVSGKYRAKKNIDLSKEVQNIRKRIISKKDKFSSLQEAMVAIQLEHQKIKYESQKEISGKKVDFYLPDLKIILEIDGEIYHKDTDKEFIRDRQIMHEVGEEYEIVHINAESVPRYTWNLKEALPYIVEQRKEQEVFRDSRCDEYLLEQFRNMELYLRRHGRNENSRLSKANRAFRSYDTE